MIEGLELATSENTFADVEYMPASENGGKSPFVVKLAYIEKQELKRLLKQHTRPTWKNHQPAEPEVDDSTFDPAFNARAIKDWSGLTIEGFKKIVGVRLSADLQEKWKDGIPCDESTRNYLMQHSYKFSQWVLDGVQNLSLFQESLEAEADQNFTNTSGKKQRKPPAN